MTVTSVRPSLTTGWPKPLLGEPIRNRKNEGFKVQGVGLGAPRGTPNEHLDRTLVHVEYVEEKLKASYPHARGEPEQTGAVAQLQV